MNEIITRCLEENRPELLERFPKEFLDETSKEIVERILELSKQYGEAPSVKKIAKEFEHFIPFTFSPSSWEKEPPPIEAVFDETIKRERERLIEKKLHEAQNFLKAGKEKAALDSLEAIQKIGSSSNGSQGKWLKGIDFLEDPNIDWVVEGVRPGGSWGMDFGPSGTYKTFVNLSQALKIATGNDWGKRKTKMGSVLYWSGEGGNSIRKRVRGLVEYLGLDSVPDTFRLCLDPLNLYTNPEGVETFVKGGKEVERETGVPVRFIVIDTLSRSSAGSDENSAKDFGIYLQSIETLLREFPKAYVSIISHVSKGGTSKMPRGHTRQINDADLAIEYQGGGTTLMAKMVCRKMKDSEEFYPIHCTGEKVNGTLVVLPSKKRTTKMGREERMNLVLQMVNMSDGGILGSSLVEEVERESLVSPRTIEKDINALVEDGLIDNTTTRPEPAFYELTPRGLVKVRGE